jgi:uncharacterized protein
MIPWSRIRLLIAGFLLLGWAVSVAALDVPFLQGRVTDDAELLRPDVIQRISARLQAHEQKTTDQVAVLTIASLQGESIEGFALRVFEQWQLGKQGKDNGVLMVIAPQDRRMRIEVGYGLEGTLTDLEAGRIIRNIMAPRFRAGDFNGGIEQGVNAVLAQLSGDNSLPPDTASAQAPKKSFIETPDLSIVERILFGAFIFGIIGLFTVIGVLTPGMGWFLYFFLIPFWAMFPIIVVGTTGAMTLLIVYLIAFPTSKIFISRSNWYEKVKAQLKSKGRASIGGFTITSGRSSGSSFSGWRSSGGSSGFSGGGGSSGGGGASGSW